MTKTLTEKYDMGNLPDGWYYIHYKNGGININPILELPMGHKYFPMLNGAEELDVLAAVPSYEQYYLLTKKAERADYLDEKLKYYTPEECLIIKRLEKKLAIATKALKRIYQPAVGDIYNLETDELDQTKLQDIAYKALKEMEGVK